MPLEAILAAWFAVALGSELWLSSRQIRYLRDHAEQPVRDRGTRRVVLAAVATGLDAALATWAILGGGIAMLAGAWRTHRFGAGATVATVVFAVAMIDAAMRLLRTRVIDRRLDGICLPWRQVIARAAAPLIPRTALGIAAGEAGAALIVFLPGSWWIWAALLWTIGLAARSALQPDRRNGGGRAAAARPPDPRLMTQMAPALTRLGLAPDRVLVIASPPNTRRANARLAGFGRSLHVELTDTLLMLLTPDEVEAVLAHEIGHWRCRHVGRDLLYRAVLAAAGFAALALSMRHPAAFAAMLGPHPAPAAWLAAAVALMPMTAPVAAPARTFWRRGMEYEADDFAASHASARALIGALAKLDRVNQTADGADRLYALFHNAHPPRAERIRRLASHASAPARDHGRRCAG